MKHRVFIQFSIFLIAISVLASCKKKEDDPAPAITTDAGFFIVNEGNYTWGNASLSFVNEVKGSIENQVFFRTNQAPLGDVAYAMYINEGKAFITINNSGKIYRIDPVTYRYEAVLQGLVSPRQMLFLSPQQALVSDLYDTRISVVNPQSMTVTGSIETGNNTEGFVLSGDRIFVTCWSFQSRVLVLSKSSLAITDTLQVGVQPRWIRSDKNGVIWVLCDGGYAGNPAGFEKPAFYTIDQNLTVIKRLEFPDTQFATYGFDMNPAGDSVFVIRNGVEAFAISDTMYPQQQLIPAQGRNFYSIRVHPSGSKLILTDAGNFSSDGKAYFYTMHGQLLNTWITGINPGWVCFR